MGPATSSSYEGDEGEELAELKPKLEVIIPTFDPGLPEDPKDYEEERVWPELRRAEANRFAYKLKVALEKTGAFGAVRVTPDKSATGDLYILGKIIESNGEDVEMGLDVVDISGQRWLSKSFDHTVEEEFYNNVRNQGTDPYDPMFDSAAAYIVEELSDYDSKQLNQLAKLTDLRFGASFSEDAFAQHMKNEDGRISLVSYPSDGDLMLTRVKAIRVRDQLFVDRLQTDYEAFSQKMDDSYKMWQEQSFQEMKAEGEANAKAAGEAIVGVLLIALAVAAAVAGAQSDNPNDASLGMAGATVAGAAGASVLSSSFQTSEEAKVHRDALAELGKSVDVELAPQVIEFEKKTVELTGTAKEQFAQWRAFLKQIYAQEATPDVLL
ncbi:MAG: hypothetical protein ISR48_02645 [Alphaproteobacteria bacterium]|nr:hypothetical protein [Alphaproteobacteria bacterium]